MQTLHICQQTKGVLGGTILYHNKVVVTQLSPEITKNLIITDPYRIKSTAEIITVDFHVPNGVQLIVVFIPIKDYRKLLSDIQRSTQQNIPNQNSSILPFQFKKKVKRDKSIIFTDIPEEGYTEYDLTNALSNENMNKQEPPPPPAAPIKCVRARPTHLPLRFKNVTTRELPESGFNSINFDESDSFPQFIGRTSVCSTPMTENKLLHGNVLSICANPDNDNETADNELKLDEPKSFSSVTTEIVQNSIEDETKQKQKSTVNKTNTNDDDKINQANNSIFTNYINNPFKYEIRRNSFNDLHNTVKKISRRISIHPFGINLAKLVMKNKSSTELHFNNYDNNNGNGNGNYNDDDYDTELDDINRKIYHTINDPTYPVFNIDGAPISKYLFQEFLERQYQEMSKNTNDDVSEMVNNTIEGFDSEIILIPASTSSQQQQPTLLSDKNVIVETSENKSNIQNSITLTKRKSLTLPLKSLTTSTAVPSTMDNCETITINEYQKESMNKIIQPITHNNLLESPAVAHRKKSGGIQLTPLMSKLTVLAGNTNDERSSGFSSWDTTPGLVDLATPIDVTKLFRRRSSIKYDDDIVEMGDGMQKVELFICGQQNMTLILLLEENSGRKQELVQSMVSHSI